MARARSDKADGATRLLPGDPVPELRLAQWFDQNSTGGSDIAAPAIDRKEAPDRVEPIRLNRLSFVVLWNGGCSVCLPTIRELAEVGAKHEVPCYGVAVMVRDVSATAQIARSNASKAYLALEERPSQPSVFSRGWVTRRWLEPSGQAGVPAAFAINANGKIAWMGHPNGIAAILPQLIDNKWDTAAERRRWLSVVSDEEVQSILVVRDVADMMLAGRIDEANKMILEAEQRSPGVMQNQEFVLTKLDVLASLPDHGDEALAHYSACAELFKNDPYFQLRSAGWVLSRMPTPPALHIVIERLISVLEGSDALGEAKTTEETKDKTTEEPIVQMSLLLVLADALARENRFKEAVQRIEQITSLSERGEFPVHLQDWLLSEIERVRRSLNVTT